MLFALTPLALQLHAQPIPNVTIKDTDGQRQNLREIQKPGKMNVVVLWRGCCTDGLALLEELTEVLASDTTTTALQAISCDDARNSRKVAGQVRAVGYEGPILLDENQDLTRALGINIFPAVILVMNNTVVWRSSGYYPGLVGEVEKEILMQR
ncbi:MAG: redoxin family protein [Bacteroidales bacterium]|nr:redoxin family protein [Bacteroidales bacterium]